MTKQKFIELRTELIKLQSRLNWLVINDSNNPKIKLLKRLIARLKVQIARRTKARGIY